MSKFKVNDLVHIRVPDGEKGGRTLPDRGRVVNVFPGGANVVNWTDTSYHTSWSVGNEFLTRALLSDFFTEGDYLFASRSVVDDLGNDQKSKTVSHVRIKIDHFSENGTRAYSVSSCCGLSVVIEVIDMHDRNPWFILPGSVDDWEEKFL